MKSVSIFEILLSYIILNNLNINNFTVFYFYHILSTWNAVFYSARLFAFTIIYYLALSSSVSHLIFSVMFAVFTFHFIIFLKSWLLRHLTKMINFLFTYSEDINFLFIKYTVQKFKSIFSFFSKRIIEVVFNTSVLSSLKSEKIMTSSIVRRIGSNS